MRKRYKQKKRSCALCKPWKTGHSNRWKNKEHALLQEFEQMKGAPSESRFIASNADIYSSEEG